MPAFGSQITCFLFNRASTQPSTTRNVNLFLAAYLFVEPLLHLFSREASAELAFLEVSDGIFSEWNIFREEVVPIITVKGVVDSASISDGAQ